MFADSLLDSPWADRSRRGWTTLVSFAAQAAVAGVLLLLPLFYTQVLPQFQLIIPAGGTLSATGAARSGVCAKHSREHQQLVTGRQVIAPSFRAEGNSAG